jgi:hypothetical protein
MTRFSPLLRPRIHVLRFFFQNANFAAKMLNNLPPEIIHSIYAAINSVSTATSLARCSKYLNTAWTSHLRTLDLVKDFSDDPRWADKKYQNFAFTIARAQIASSDGSCSCSTLVL